MELKGRLHRKVAIVTGASSGVGRSIAIALAQQGMDLALLGRRIGLLRSVVNQCRDSGSNAVSYRVDLLRDSEIRRLKERIVKDFGRVDVLVHSAGVFTLAPFERATLADFDRQYRSNVRAPFALTQLLLPFLIRRQGYIVFINSTAGLMASKGVSQYSATKHALKAVADSLRDEVNVYGVRVLSVYLGRTATPMQAKVHELEGKDYHPAELIQPEQVAEAVVCALAMGREAELTDIRMRPAIKSGMPVRKRGGR